MSYLGKEPVASSNNETRQGFVAAAGQTVFTVGYTPGYLDVFVNGTLQINDVDYYAISGSSFTMRVGLLAGDEVFASARFTTPPRNAHGTIESTFSVNVLMNSTKIFKGVTVPLDTNAMIIGPVTLADDVAITIPDGSTLTIL